VSAATFYHTDKDTIDFSMTATAGDGSYGKGLKIGSDGVSIIYDNSPSFQSQLDCKN
jgi:hypothetical protein